MNTVGVAGRLLLRGNEDLMRVVPRVTQDQAQRIIKNRLRGGAMWVAGGKGLAVIGSLIANILLARLLAPSDVGIFFLAFSLAFFLSIAAQLGIGEWAVKALGQTLAQGQPNHAWAVALRAYSFTAVGCVIFSGVLLFGGVRVLALEVFNAPGLLVLNILLPAWVAATAFRAVTVEMHRGLHDLRTASVLDEGLSWVLMSLLLIAATVMQWNVTIVMAVQFRVAALLVPTLIGIALLRRRVRHCTPREPRPERMKSLSESVPMMLSTLALTAGSQGVIWILAAVQQVEEVALFSTAFRLANQVGIALVIMNLTLPSTITEQHAEGELLRLERIIRKSATIAGVPTILGVLVLIPLSGALLRVLFGPFYTAGATILSILALGQLVNVLSGPAGKVMKLMGGHNAFLRLTAASTAMALIILVPVSIAMGGIGAASVVAFWLASVTIASAVWVYRTHGIRTWMYWRRQDRSSVAEANREMHLPR